MNQLSMTGRLTKDPVLKKTPAGIEIVEFSIANNYYTKQNGNDNVNFFNVTSFGSNAKYITEYGRKGINIGIEGMLRQERWTDKNGNNASKITIIATRIEILTPKSNEGSNTNKNYQPNERTAYYNPNNDVSNNVNDYGYGYDDDEDDVPF